MSYQSTSREKYLSLAAGAVEAVEIGLADWLLFTLLPAGIQVQINEQPYTTLAQGLLHFGPPGEGNFRSLRFRNTTGGPLDAHVLYGLGAVAFSGGQVSITGTLPLPSGAATAAKQDTQTTRLNLLATEAKQDTQITRLNLLGTEVTLAALLAAVATAAKQDAQTALLTTLAANVAVTADVVTITGSQAFANCRALSVTNTGAANITVNNGAGARTIIPGDSVDWPCVGPFAKYGSITVDATGSSAVVVTTV